MKACFVCGSMSHLIKDYTFYEDRMAKKSVLPNNVGKGTGHRESRPVWNNIQRINHQSKFAPTTVFTNSERIPVSAAKSKVATSTSAAKPVNTAGPKQSVNFSNSISTFHKSHSPIKRSFYNETTHSKSNSIERVNTAGSKAVSAVNRIRVTVVKASGGCVWRPRVNKIEQISRDNRWICTRVDYGHPHQALKNKGIVDSGCFRHMTGKKAYLVNYQEINDGGFVAFGSSRGKIVGKEGKAAQSHLAVVTKQHNKTPYELLNGRSPRLDFMRPFGCPITILNTLDPLGKFKSKANEGFLVGYFVTRNQTDKNGGPQDTNGNASTQDNVDARKEVSDQHYILLPLWSSISSAYKSSHDKAEDDKPKEDTGSKTVVELVNKEDQAYRDAHDRLISQEKEANDAVDSLRTFSAGRPSSPYPDAFILDDTLLHVDQDDSQIPDLVVNL
nr:retrovirus-related Pol polyprotein from transposon TNT 1-94 [Tanacetum cinerariifolium]